MINIDNVLENNIPEHLRTINTTNVLNSFVLSFNVVENNVDNLKNEIQIDTASGEELDDIAKLYSLARDEGESDDLFRSRIKNYVDIKNIDGVRKYLKNYLINLTGETSIEVNEFPTNPMKLYITGFLPLDWSQDRLRTIVEEIKVAGTKIFYSFNIVVNEEVSFTDTYEIQNPDNLFVIEESEIEGPQVLS